MLTNHSILCVQWSSATVSHFYDVNWWTSHPLHFIVSGPPQEYFMYFFPTQYEPPGVRNLVILSWMIHWILHEPIEPFPNAPKYASRHPKIPCLKYIDIKIWSNYSDLTLVPQPKIGREIPLYQGNLGWWNIIIWPEKCHSPEVVAAKFHDDAYRSNTYYATWFVKPGLGGCKDMI